MALKFVNRRRNPSRTEIPPIPHTDRIISRTAISTEYIHHPKKQNTLIKYEKMMKYGNVQVMQS
jgi:hypothetical protein